MYTNKPSFSFFPICLLIMLFFSFFAIATRSPLSQIHQIQRTPTLLFIGLEDERVLPEAQGIALYKAMRSQKLSPTSLYHYPREGHYVKAIESLQHMLLKSVTWMHKHWRSFDPLCTIDPPPTPEAETTTTIEEDTTPETTSEIATTKKPIVTTPSSAAAPSQDFYKATFVILAMQFFTLNAWYQLRQ